MKSLWHETVNLPEFPSLDRDIKTDVLIIGGGIAGILTAHFLQEKGVPYILVEKNRLCGGTTGNTTAKITYQHGLIYSRILKSYGAETARIYLMANRKAFEKFAELCRDTDCDYEKKDNFVYSKTDRQKLEDEMDALEKIGYDAGLVESTPPARPYRRRGLL